jgi:hypothetical protein
LLGRVIRPLKGEAPVNPISALPAGIRLDDAWPRESAPEPCDAPEVAQLRDELRKSMPEMAGMLETLATYRPIQELVGRLAAPQAAKLVTHRS